MRFVHRLWLLGQGDAGVAVVVGPWLVHRRADYCGTATCVRACIQAVAVGGAHCSVLVRECTGIVVVSRVASKALALDG